MLHVKSCNVKHNSESAFRYSASAVNSNYRVQNVIEKIFMLSVVIHALKSRLDSPVHLLQIVVWYTATGLLKSPCIAHQPDGIHPVQIHLIGIRDSPNHRSVRNKEVKFIWIYPLGPRFSVCCPYYRESVLSRFLLKKIHLRILSGH